MHCRGIITGAGLKPLLKQYILEKRSFSIPIRGQYEQACNATALEKLGITCLKNIDPNFSSAFYHWIQEKKSVSIDYSKTIPETLEYLFSLHEKVTAQKLQMNGH